MQSTYIQDGLLRSSNLHLSENDTNEPCHFFGIHLQIKLSEYRYLFGFFRNQGKFIEAFINFSNSHITKLVFPWPLGENFVAPSRKISSHATSGCFTRNFPIEENLTVIRVRADLEDFNKKLSNSFFFETIHSSFSVSFRQDETESGVKVAANLLAPS